MKKFCLTEFKKSVHFTEKQEERSICDYTVEKVLNFGEAVYMRGVFNYRWGNKVVVACTRTMTLITTYDGDYPEENPKVLNKDNVLPFRRPEKKKKAA